MKLHLAKTISTCHRVCWMVGDARAVARQITADETQPSGAAIFVCVDGVDAAQAV
ncbi:hypothetical protein [Thiocystis violascens]|uniref:Uncharacterized protein n=1 Tax=Thiocystis violascens (strain ATCC 17096 / DSM 198 / 6111) TaxID=765911 RepID=I3YCT0_THIV6|nr:hypothetical protein [Thiocystis violascens]AFL74798.1 hypothetical protein Thivi_2892 [Thiocystis violascens DSM 198]